MQLIGDIFVLVLVQPLLNLLVLLYALLFQNMAVAIVALTVLIRVVTYPLTIKQIRSSARMQALQPQMKALQERHKGNPQAIQRETMRLYREAGMNPLGCLGPMVIQFVLWIPLYYVIVKGLGDLPGTFFYLSQRLYPWLPVGAELLPFNNRILWLDLTLPDPTPILPLLVAASTYGQQKMMQPATMSPEQRQQQTIMLFMFPIMLGFLAFTFPAGLALYWFVSNAISIGTQGLVMGWSGLRFQRAPAVAAPSAASDESRASDGREPGGLRQDGRGGGRGRPAPARNRPRRSRRRRP
ncbi:MAG: membrane protein insertase YidC [Chloroflexi bacterium]|nr:membrane protein insertase YidC [Chloroflexota bacterium]